MAKSHLATLKHAALAPIYLYQAKRVKKSAIRLPEPKGERQGTLVIDNNLPTVQTLNLMIVGDSSAAGVGCDRQTEGLAQNLANNLQALFFDHTTTNYSAIHWSLNAKSGDSSFDLLKRLFIMPKQSVEVIVICIGVNDVTKNISKLQWQKNINEIVAISQRKFGARFIIFSSLPPMKDMPALPAPLNQLLGNKAQQINTELQQICESKNGVYYFAPKLTDKQALSTMFATDGFHPSPKAYGVWAAALAKTIFQQLAD